MIEGGGASEAPPPSKVALRLLEETEKNIIFNNVSTGSLKIIIGKKIL